MYHQIIPAYEGNSPFIYACFCTEDEDLAFPVLARMYNEGFRVFPAQVGSAPSDFRAAQRLNASSHVILFMSASMSDLMRRESGKVAAVLRSACLRTVVLLDDVNPSNDTYALSAPDRVIYNPINDSPFWLYIYNSEYYEKCRGPWPEKKLKIGAPEFEDVSETTLGEEYDLLSDIIRRGTPVRESAQIAFAPVSQSAEPEERFVGGFADRPLDSAVSEVVGMIDLHLEKTASILVSEQPDAQAPAAVEQPEPADEFVAELAAITEAESEEIPAEPEVESASEDQPEPAAQAESAADVQPESESAAGSVSAAEPEPAAEPVAQEPEAEETAAAEPIAAASVEEPAASSGMSQVNVVVRSPKRRTKTQVIARRRASSGEAPLHLHTRVNVPVAQLVQPTPTIQMPAATEPAAPAVSARRHRARPMPAAETLPAPEPAAVQHAEQEQTVQTEEPQTTARKNRHEHNRLNLRRLIQIAKNSLASSQTEELLEEETTEEQETKEDNSADAPLCAAVSRFLCAYGSSTVTVIPKPALQQRQR